MVTSPTSLNPPSDRRSISIDDYQPPAPSSPQQSSSESDNDENDPTTRPAPHPTRPPRRRKIRKSTSSISLDSLDRDELVDDFPTNPHTNQPKPSTLPKRPRLGPLPPQNLKQKDKQVVKPNLVQVPPPATPVTASPEMEPDEPLTEDSLVNIASLSPTDDLGWDRFIFFSHRSQRHDFPKDSYLSNFSPFSAVASAMIGLSTRSVCAVCGAGGTLNNCNACPLTFHPSCANPLNPAPVSTSWTCPACTAAKKGGLRAGWSATQNGAPSPLPDPSTGLKRLIADVKEGNPIDMIFSPSLFKYYKSIAGADWLRCTRCHRIRIVDSGVLSEAVRIPFECSYAFWLEVANRRCDPQGEPRIYDKHEQRVNQFLRSRKTQRQLLFRFGFGEENAEGRADMDNLPVLRAVKPLPAQLKKPSVSPMQISPAEMQISPAASPTVPAQSVQPAKPSVIQRAQPQVVGLTPQTIPPRQFVQPTAQQVQPQVGSVSVTPQPSPEATPQGRVAVPEQTAAAPVIQVSPTISTAAADAAKGTLAKPEPLENAQNSQQDLLTFIATLDWEEWLEDALTDLALADNKQLIQLYAAFHSSPAKFQRQATRLAQRMKGNMRPQTPAQPQLQPQVRPQPQSQTTRSMQMHTAAQMSAQPMQMQVQQAPMQLQQQAPMQVQQAPMQVQQAPMQVQPATQMQTAGMQRLSQPTIDSMFRQMAIRHVRDMQDLEQQYMQRMEQVPATQVAELMGMKDVTVAKLKHRQQEEVRQFYHTHGMR